MVFYPPKDAEITIWLLYSRCDAGTFIEGAFTNKTQAESMLRWHEANDRNNSAHWLREIVTQAHEV